METKDILKRIKLKKDGKFLGIGTSPEADWQVIFFSGLALLVLVILLSLNLFVRVNTGEAYRHEETLETRDKALNTTLLLSTVKYYSEKEANFYRIRSSKSSIPDPSI